MAETKIGDWCPLIQMKCKEHKCRFYIMVRGTDVNTGKEVDDWGCSFAFMPMLMIENSNVQRQTGAAVESFRNEMVAMNNPQLPWGRPELLPKNG